MDPVVRLRGVLEAAGYRADTIAARLGLASMAGFKAADAPVYLRRLPADDDALDTLVRILLLHAPVGPERVSSVFSTDDVSGLVAAGVLDREGDRIRSPLTIVPDAGLLFAYDHTQGHELRDDSVLGITSAARTLSAMTVRTPVARALDVGTGCGVQALLAARHSSRVVAVDVNPRALWLTDLNCRLNAIANVECREGDLFDPVRSETFDLVVSNPPFVVSPGVEYIYRDSELGGDGVSRAAVTGAAGVLADGGFATVMCNWVTRAGQPWWAPLSEWVDGLGCDAVLVHYETLDPLSYAAAWNEELAPDPEALGTALDRWLAYYADRQVGAVAMGAVILRRRSAGDPWVFRVELRTGPSGPAGDQVERIFSAQDRLATATDDDVLDLRFRGVEGHRLEQVLQFRDGVYSPAGAVVVLDHGFGVRNSVDPLAVHVLLRMDGVRPLRELVAEATEETGFDEDVMRARAVEGVRELYGLGLLSLGGVP